MYGARPRQAVIANLSELLGHAYCCCCLIVCAKQLIMCVSSIPVHQASCICRQASRLSQASLLLCRTTKKNINIKITVVQQALAGRCPHAERIPVEMSYGVAPSNHFKKMAQRSFFVLPANDTRGKHRARHLRVGATTVQLC